MKKRLSLKKTTITRLNDLKQQAVKAGADTISPPYCTVGIECKVYDTIISCPNASIVPCSPC